MKQIGRRRTRPAVVPYPHRDIRRAPESRERLGSDHPQPRHDRRVHRLSLRGGGQPCLFIHANGYGAISRDYRTCWSGDGTAVACGPGTLGRR